MNSEIGSVTLSPQTPQASKKTGLERQFYDKPYVTCKECLKSNFKCKDCLQQLVQRLRQYRKQHDLAVEEQRRQLARHYYTKSSTEKLDEAAQQKFRLTQLPQDFVVKLNSLKSVTPILHHTTIELPQRYGDSTVRQQSQVNSPAIAAKIERWKHQNSQQLLNISDRADESQDKANNRLSVHTIEAPSIEREQPITKHQPKPKNRPKQPGMNSQREKRKKSTTDTFLPCIRQLNICERQRGPAKEKIVPPNQQTIRQNEAKRRSVQLVQRQQSTTRATPSSMHALLPVSAWEHQDRNAYQHEINY